MEFVDIEVAKNRLRDWWVRMWMAGRLSWIIRNRGTVRVVVVAVEGLVVDLEDGVVEGVEALVVTAVEGVVSVVIVAEGAVVVVMDG